MDDTTFTTLRSPSSGASAKSRLNCRALFDTGLPQSFIHQSEFDQMVATGAADASYVQAITPKSQSGFGSQKMLSTSRQARMTGQFHHNGVPSASLAVWIYLVPDETMSCPILLGGTTACASIRVLIRRYRRHQTGVYLVNSPSLTLRQQLSAIATFLTSPNTSSMQARACP